MQVTVSKEDNGVKIIKGNEIFYFTTKGNANKRDRLNFFYIQVRDEIQYLDFKYEDLTDTLGATNIDEFIDILNDFFFELSSSSSSGTGWKGEVGTFAELPLADTENDGQVYLVKTPTGSQLTFNLKRSGFYVSNGTSWNKLSNAQVLFTDDELTFKDDLDNTKQVGFQIDQVATGQRRIATWQDKDITVADDADLQQEILDRTNADNNLQTQIDNKLESGDNVSELVNDSGYISVETDPVFSASEAANFVSGDKANLDNQSGVNTGDETTLSIQTKRPLKTINNNNLEGSGNINTIPQYEILTSLDILNNNPRAGQTTEGLINNTTTFEIFIDQEFIPNKSVNYHCGTNLFFSLNDGAQDFLCNLQIFQGATLVGSLAEVFRIEPKDTGSLGVVLNTLSGGNITGSANTSTNQRDYRGDLSFDVTLTQGLIYNLRLSWAGSDANDLAAIYSGKTYIEERIIS